MGQNVYADPQLQAAYEKGLKVGRVVDYCAARLQIQERLAQDIVDMIRNALGDEYPPLAIGVVLEGEHLCKTMRGVKNREKCVLLSILIMEAYPN